MENNKKIYVLYSWDDDADITIKGVFDESRLNEMEELCKPETGISYYEFTLNNIDLVPMYHGEVVVYCKDGHPIVEATVRTMAVGKDTPEYEREYQKDSRNKDEAEMFARARAFEIREEIGDDLDKARLHLAYSHGRELWCMVDESVKPLEPILSLSLPLHKNVTMGGDKSWMKK